MLENFWLVICEIIIQLNGIVGTVELRALIVIVGECVVMSVPIGRQVDVSLECQSSFSPSSA